MAEFGSFGVGLAKAQDARLTREETQRKNAVDAEDKLRDDIRAQSEQTSTILKDTMDRTMALNNSMNDALVQAAKTGQLTPELAAQVHHGQATTLTQTALVIEDVKRTMILAGADPGDVQALGSGMEFVTQTQAANEAAAIAALAQGPVPTGQAEGIAKLEMAETMLNRPLTNGEVKDLLAIGKDPRLINLMSETGERRGFNIAEPTDVAEMNKLLKTGKWWEVNASIQADSAEGLTKKQKMDFTNLQIQTTILMGETRRLRQMIAESDNLFTGLAGTVIGGLNTMVNQYEQFARFIGGDEAAADPDVIGPDGMPVLESFNLDMVYHNMEKNGMNEKLVDAARQSRAFSFNVIGLAFMLARLADPNDRLSAQEVQVQINRLGDGNLSTIGAILDESDRFAMNVFDANVQVLSVDPREAAKIEGSMTPFMREQLNTYRGSGGTTAAPEPTAKLPDNVRQVVELAPTDPNARPSDLWVSAFNALSPEEKKAAKEAIKKRIEGGK
jgi:hypothetical protein